MKAARIHAFGGVEQLRVEEAPDPVAGAGEVLVRLVTASINPIDLALRQGMPRLLQAFPIHLPAILGCDGAGTVQAVGDGVTGLAKGDRVIVRLVPTLPGTYAELAVVPVDSVASLPDQVGFEAGATLPLVGLTARQMVAALGGIKAGDRVLVAGGLGSVGRAAVQYLIEIGAVPVAGVRGSRLDEGRAVAGEAVAMESAPEGGAFDLALAAAAPVGAATVAWVRDGGRVASAVQIAPEARREGVTVSNIMAMPDVRMLAEIAEAAGRGDLVIPVARTFPLDRIADAHQAVAEGAAGKVVIVI